MNVLLILAINLQAAPLPSVRIPNGATWVQELDCRAEPKDSSLPSERIIFRDTIERKAIEELTISRIPIQSWVGEMLLTLSDKPSPWQLVERRKAGCFPVLEPDPGDRFTKRLWRATRYCDVSSLKMEGENGAGIPAAEYRAEVIESKDGRIRVKSVFTEIPGIRAKGDWTFDEHGQIQRAEIICENAFNPGGDGSPYTYRVSIKKVR